MQEEKCKALEGELDAAKEKLDMDAKIIQAGKFNNHSTDADRQELLTTLLRSNESSLADVEVPDDTALNGMISRSEDEFELFQRMDEEDDDRRERRWKEGGIQ